MCQVFIIILIVFAVVPLLLLFCICSGVGAAADFKTIPFDAKEHLIVYNTEGQGDDKVHVATRQNLNYNTVLFL